MSRLLECGCSSGAASEGCRAAGFWHLEIDGKRINAITRVAPRCVHCEGWGCRRCSPVVSAPQRPGPQPEPLKRDPVPSLEPVRDLSLEDQRMIQAHSPGAMAMTSHKPGIYPVGSELWQAMFAGYRTDTKRRPFDLTLWRKSRTGHYVYIESTTVSAVDGFEAARIASEKWHLHPGDWQADHPTRSRPPYIIRNDTPEAP